MLFFILYYPSHQNHLHLIIILCIIVYYILFIIICYHTFILITIRLIVYMFHNHLYYKVNTDSIYEHLNINQTHF